MNNPDLPFSDFGDDIQSQYKTIQASKGFVIKGLPLEDALHGLIYIWVYRKGLIVIAVALKVAIPPDYVEENLRRIATRIRGLLPEENLSLFMPLTTYNSTTGLLKGEKLFVSLKQAPLIFQQEVIAVIGRLSNVRPREHHLLFLSSEAKALLMHTFNSCLDVALFSKFKNDMLTACKITASEAKKIS